MRLAASQSHASLTVHRKVRPEKLLTNKVFVYTTLRKQTAALSHANTLTMKQ
jgi:hypothetical protein